MSRKLLFSAVVLLSISSANAIAQEAPGASSTQTTTTTINNGSYVTSKTTSETQHTVDADGTEITKSKTFKSGDGALSGTSRLQVTMPDGLTKTIDHEEHTSAPTPLTSTSRETTTTTIDR